jgi:hypothetical protein
VQFDPDTIAMPGRENECGSSSIPDFCPSGHTGGKQIIVIEDHMKFSRAVRDCCGVGLAVVQIHPKAVHRSSGDEAIASVVSAILTDAAALNSNVISVQVVVQVAVFERIEFNCEALEYAPPDQFIMR